MQQHEEILSCSLLVTSGEAAHPPLLHVFILTQWLLYFCVYHIYLENQNPLKRNRNTVQVAGGSLLWSSDNFKLSIVGTEQNSTAPLLYSFLSEPELKPLQISLDSIMSQPMKIKTGEKNPEMYINIEPLLLVKLLMFLLPDVDVTWHCDVYNYYLFVDHHNIQLSMYYFISQDMKPTLSQLGHSQSPLEVCSPFDLFLNIMPDCQAHQGTLLLCTHVQVLR